MLAQNYPYKISLVASTQLISDNDLAGWVRLINPHTSETATLKSLLSGQIAWIESNTDYQIQRANYEWFTDSIPVSIPKKPYNQLTEIAYLDSDNTYQVIPNTDYRVVKSGGASCKIIFTGTKPTLQKAEDAVRVKFIAGWADADVPADIITVLQLRIGRLFDNRADSIDELDNISEVMLEPYRAVQLA